MYKKIFQIYPQFAWTEKTHYRFNRRGSNLLASSRDIMISIIYPIDSQDNLKQPASYYPDCFRKCKIFLNGFDFLC